MIFPNMKRCPNIYVMMSGTKIVVAPKKWCKEFFTPKDIYGKDWVLL